MMNADDKLLEKRFELHRQTSIGRALDDELDNKFHSQDLTVDDCEKVSAIFDKVMKKHMDKFNEQEKKIAYRMNGKLNTYRFFDRTWEFEVSNLEAQRGVDGNPEVRNAKRIYFKTVEGKK